MKIRQFYNPHHDEFQYWFVLMTVDRSIARNTFNLFGGMTYADDYTNQFRLELVYD